MQTGRSKVQEQVGQKGCTTSCAPLLPTKYISTYQFSNWCFIANSLGLVLRRRFNIPWPAQPAQPAIECLKSSVAIPTSRLPLPTQSLCVGLGVVPSLPFHAVDDDTSCSSSLLSVACTQHAQLSIVCMLLISECPISSCSWIGDCDSMGISIFVCERMHHSSPLLCTLAIHFRCCFNFLFVVFFS